MAAFFQGCTKWWRSEGEAGLPEMRRGIGISREQGQVWLLAAFEAALAEAEARAGETNAGLRRLDGALAELERTEQRWYEAEMHRIRAEIRLKRDPADTAAAEQSLQAAIAIAQSQKARSFELRAALALAKLYHAINRDADAHSVLIPAVDGFPPTQQLPELTAAQALLAALSESDAVKRAAGLRQRRLHLQTSLGNALMWVKGQDAPETSATFARARKLASREEDASERFSAYYGLWAGHAIRCEPAPMREMAGLFLREATARPNCPETLIAHRVSGATCFYFGDFAGSHDHYQKSLELYDQTRHAGFANRFGQDPRAAAETVDAVALWVLGRIDEALRLADRALADAESAAHVPTMAYALIWTAFLGLFRRSPEAVATYSQALADIVSRYDLPPFWAGLAAFLQGWANWSDGAEESTLAEMRRGLAVYREQVGFALGRSRGGPGRSRSECRRDRCRAPAPGRCARRIGAHGGALVRSGNAPTPRRDPAEARPGRYRGGRAVFADRDRDRAVAKSAGLRTARCAGSGETLSRGQSRRRRPRRAGACGRGLPADPTIPRTHRGANPSLDAEPLEPIGVDQKRLTAGRAGMAICAFY